MQIKHGRWKRNNRTNNSLNGAVTKIGGALWKIQCLKDTDLTV